MTPLQIEILLHYWSRIDDVPNLDAPAVREAIDQFLVHGILEDVPEEPGRPYRKYRCNRAAMRVYVEALGAVPLPRQAWVIPVDPAKLRHDADIPF